jgi:hypothetical protein
VEIASQIDLYTGGEVVCYPVAQLQNQPFVRLP